MPKTTNPPAARRRRRGRHREQRLKILATEPQWLANDAPYGEYRVDFVAMELFLRCAGLSTYGEDEFVRLVREGVSGAASLAMMFARRRLRWRPEKLLLTSRLFEDVRHIQSRIRRSQGLDPGEIRRLLKPISIRKVRYQDVVEPLWSSMRKLDGAIRDFLETYRSHSKGGNYDWLTRNFIDECFELWCRYVQVEFNNEAQVFNKFVAAAWRDVNFPTSEQDGRCLEEWLADRVRKHFHDKICNARREQQELNQWLDNERIRSGLIAQNPRGIHPEMGAPIRR
jgi:hypothetical protein